MTKQRIKNAILRGRFYVIFLYCERVLKRGAIFSYLAKQKPSSLRILMAFVLSKIPGGSDDHDREG